MTLLTYKKKNFFEQNIFIAKSKQKIIFHFVDTSCNFNGSFHANGSKKMTDKENNINNKTSQTKKYRKNKNR